MKSKAWTVRLGNFAPFRVPSIERPIRSEVVFYDEDMTAEDVRRSLISHDGYPEGIRVFRNFKVKT